MTYPTGSVLQFVQHGMARQSHKESRFAPELPEEDQHALVLVLPAYRPRSATAVAQTGRSRKASADDSQSSSGSQMNLASEDEDAVVSLISPQAPLKRCADARAARLCPVLCRKHVR